jgi:hypothetical protein
MTEIPPAAPPPAENPFWATLRQPRVVLILLAVWEIIGALAEFFTSSGLFVNLHGGEIDGALAGRALGWEAIPLAVLYLYCARDPARYHHVFWLALIEQAAAIVANVYHWGAGDFSFESVVIPAGVAAGLGLLVFLHLFEPKEREPAASI